MPLMPWELSAIPADSRESLGTVEQVQSRLRHALPTIKLFRDADGSEKIRAMESKGIEVPPFIRDIMLRTGGSYLGLLEGDGWTIEFSLGQDENCISRVAIDVRGSGNPMPSIECLAAIPGWKIIDVNGAKPTRESWAAFGTWRDDAIDELGQTS
jgi:hypothetical protein